MSHVSMKRQRYLATGLERALMGYANLPSKGGRHPLSAPDQCPRVTKETNWMGEVVTGL